MADIVKGVEARKRLRALLLERPEYTDAYNANAEFRVAVDSIVNLIPAVLKTSYDSAVEAQIERHRAYQASLLAAPPVFGYTPRSKTKGFG